MKRMLLCQTPPKISDISEKHVADEGMENVIEVSQYITELRLLKDVPFSYLIADEALLPPDSIRFFYVDENWLDALSDGAMSVGRVTETDARIDADVFPVTVEMASGQLAVPRFSRMHRNHRRFQTVRNTESEVRTGFILRSGLVGKWKGLEVSGKGNGKQLEILRMESLSSEILLCIFDGELDEFIVSEPKTGLRFGAPDTSGIITLRDVSDTDNFGNPLKGVTVDLNQFTESNGRIQVSALAEEMHKKTANPVSSCQYAFELIAVAKRAEFHRGGA